MSRRIWQRGDRLSIVPGRYTSNDKVLNNLIEVEYINNTHSYSNKDAVIVAIKKGTTHSCGWSERKEGPGEKITLFKDCLMFSEEELKDNYSIW